MSAERKSVQVRIYLSPEEQDALKEIKSRLRTQSEAWILSTLTGSALRGIQAGGYRFPLPLTLGVIPENEPKTGKK